MRFTVAGAIASEEPETEEGAASLLVPGASDIADMAAGTSGISGLLAGGGAVVDAFRRDLLGRTVPGIDDATGGRLRLFVESTLEDSRERIARQRGEPPVPTEEGEEFTGPDSMTLRSNEKPAVLAVIEENIRENGTPESITLIIKKLNSDRFRPITYTIFKKSVFTDELYDEGTELIPTVLGLSASPRYFGAILTAGFRIADVLTFTDTNIEAGRVYAYKVRCEFDGDTDTATEEIEEAEAMVEALFGTDPEGLGGGITSTGIGSNVFAYGGRGVMSEAIAASLGVSSEGARRSTDSSSGASGIGGSTGREGVDLGGSGGGFGF